MHSCVEMYLKKKKKKCLLVIACSDSKLTELIKVPCAFMSVS